MCPEQNLDMLDVHGLHPTEWETLKQSRFPLSIPRIPNIGTQLDLESGTLAGANDGLGGPICPLPPDTPPTPPRSIDRGPSSTRLWGARGSAQATPLSDLQATGVVGMDRDITPAWLALPSGNGWRLGGFRDL
jgi:hypothetical protein